MAKGVHKSGWKKSGAYTYNGGKPAASNSWVSGKAYPCSSFPGQKAMSTSRGKLKNTADSMRTSHGVTKTSHCNNMNQTTGGYMVGCGTRQMGHKMTQAGKG